MRLQIIHRTHYQYAGPVAESFNEVRLQPVSADGQVCHSFILRVIPATRMAHYLDFYYNCVHFFEVQEPHSSLSIEANSTVTTRPAQSLGDEAEVPFLRLEECGSMENCYDFLQPSTYINLTPEAWRLALDVCAGQTGVWQACVTVMRFIHANFTYTPSTTSVHTRMREVLEQRRGVCQDFAHVMIGLCRSLRIPARYVSGYLYNGPLEQLVGSQASHAWCEVFVPGLGWLGLDPTNNRQVDEHYVKVGVGRDYADIAPAKGHYKGTSDKTLSVEVLVTRVD